MPNSLGQQVASAFGHALETMAFISPEPIELVSEPPRDAVIVQLDFTGGTLAGIDLLVDRTFGHVIAANIMGEEDLGFAGADVLLELINVTAGTFLRQSQCGSTEMNVPRIAPFAAGEWTSFISAGHTSFFDANGNTVAVRLRGEK